MILVIAVLLALLAVAFSAFVMSTGAGVYGSMLIARLWVASTYARLVGGLRRRAFRRRAREVIMNALHDSSGIPIDLEALTARARGLPYDFVKGKLSPQEGAAFAATKAAYEDAADDLIAQGLIEPFMESFVVAGEGPKDFVVPGMYRASAVGMRAIARSKAAKFQREAFAR